MSVDAVAWSWRTPLGDDVDAAVRRLLAGERAATDRATTGGSGATFGAPRSGEGNRATTGDVRRSGEGELAFDASGYACRVGAPVLGEPRPSRHARFLRRMGLFGLEAAHEAFTRARLDVAPDRLGVFCGYGGLRAHWDEMMPALTRQREDLTRTWELGLKLLHPYWMLKHLSNNAHALLAADLHARGDGATFGGATAGAQALAAAERSLEAGAIDAALVLAYDSLLEPETLVELAANGQASTAALDALRAPYDGAARGFVPGEAAAAVLLVRTAERPLARLTCTGRLAPAELADGAGDAAPSLDVAERDALAAKVGPGAPLTCVQSAFGRLGAASALVQAIALGSCLRRGTLPPIAGLAAAPEGPLRPLRAAEPTRATSALARSTGAPGLTASIRIEVC